MTSRAQAEAARRSLRQHLTNIFGPSLDGVNGVGIGLNNEQGEDNLVVEVYIDPEVEPDQRAQIPSRIYDVPVRVDIVGIAEME